MAHVGLAKAGASMGKATCDPWSYGVTYRLAPGQFLEKTKVRRPWQVSCNDTGLRASLGQKEREILTGQMWAS